MTLYLAFLLFCSIESSDGLQMRNHEDPLCVGWTQMRPVAVRDCNRICKLQGDTRRFKLADRYDKRKCFDMFEILVTYYLGDTPNCHDIALLWCRGNTGKNHKQTERTKLYLKKLRIELKKRGLDGRERQRIDAPRLAAAG